MQEPTLHSKSKRRLQINCAVFASGYILSCPSPKYNTNSLSMYKEFLQSWNKMCILMAIVLHLLGSLRPVLTEVPFYSRLI